MVILLYSIHRRGFPDISQQFPRNASWTNLSSPTPLLVSVKPSPAKTNRQAPTSLPVCLIIMVVFFGKIHPFPKCSLAFSVAFVQKQIAVWIIKLFRLLPLLEKCGFYNLKYPTVEIFARCGTICFYAVQDKISKEIFLVHRITVF